MNKILLINGKKEFGHSKGDLNQYFTDIANTHLNDLDYDIKVTNVDNGYNIEAEIDKWL